MRIESALYTSKEGIDAHGQAISVIGDNISNSNTVGYKTSRVEFADLMSAGVDAAYSEVLPYTGSGAVIQRVRPLHESGIIEDTGRSLDLAVDGNGFFLVGDPAAPKLSRAGNFQVSQDGFLETSSGDRVLGLAGSSTEISEIDMVHVNTSGKATSSVQLTGNLSSALPATTAPESAESFSDLQKAASFSASIDVYDSLGASHAVTLYFFKTEAGKWTAQAYVDAGETGGTAGTPKQIGKTSITFDTMGQFSAGEPINASVTFDGAAASNFTVDLSKMTQFATESGITNVTRDGQSGGSIEGYEVRQDGTIMALLAGGSTVQVGRIQLASVQNIDGLDRAGNTLFSETSRSGERTTGNPGESGFGKIRGGALERSTVDISEQFVNLVLVQRGYQANAQVLNQVNDLLKQAIAMLR